MEGKLKLGLGLVRLGLGLGGYELVLLLLFHFCLIINYSFFCLQKDYKSPNWSPGSSPSLRSCPLPFNISVIGSGGHDTFLLQITCKKARIWTFFWLDRKQYGWFVLFRLAKTPPSVSCCWLQSPLNEQWSLWNFCRLSFLEFEECLNRNFIHWNIFHFIVY